MGSEEGVTGGFLGVEVALIGDVISGVDSLVDEFVAAFVEGVAGVAFDPFPIDLVDCDGGVEALPEVFVEDGFFVGFFPAAFFPAVEPVLGEGVDEVFGVGVDGDVTGFGEEFEGADGGHEFHAIVGGMIVGSVDLLAEFVEKENGSEASGPGVSAGAAIGINVDGFHWPKLGLGPLAEGFDVVGGAITEPGVELGGVLELLAAKAGDDEEVGLDFGEGGEVRPEFFELEDGEDVLLSVAPAFFYFLDGDVGGEFGGDVTDSGGDFFPVVGEEVVAGEAEEGEELVEVDPGRHGVVVGEGEFVFLAREGEAFEEAGAFVDAGEAATAVFESAGDDLEGEAGAGVEVVAEEAGVEIGTEGIDVMQHEGLELRAFFEEGGEGAVEEEVGNFEEVADGVEALEGEVVGVVAGFAL